MCSQKSRNENPGYLIFNPKEGCLSQFVWLAFSQLLLLVDWKDESQHWAFLSTD